jgi:ABC-2 type transport system ATP-binding protein
MDEADRVVDRLAIIDQGKLLALDTPSALKEKLGEGDVLEFSVTETCSIYAVQENLKKQFAEVSVSGNVITLRGHGLVDLLPKVLATLEALGCKAGDVHLRQNTLEDVFLALTGRRLRE